MRRAAGLNKMPPLPYRARQRCARAGYSHAHRRRQWLTINANANCHSTRRCVVVLHRRYGNIPCPSLRRIDKAEVRQETVRPSSRPTLYRRHLMLGKWNDKYTVWSTVLTQRCVVVLIEARVKEMVSVNYVMVHVKSKI